MKNQVYVLGGFQTDFSRNFTKEGKGAIDLLREAAENGLAACGMTFADVERLRDKGKIACFVGNFIGELFLDQGHLGALLSIVHPAFWGVPCARYEAACASGSAALDAASTKIRAGDYDVALVIGFELMKTVKAATCGDYLGRAAYYATEGKGVSLPFPKLFDRIATETILKYKPDEEQYWSDLAIIAAKNYENAKRNECAQTRNWDMGIAQTKARGIGRNVLVGEKLAVTDCSQITDGAAAVVLCSQAYLDACGVRADFPVIKGYGHRVAPMLLEDKLRASGSSKYLLPYTRLAVTDAYSSAGLDVRDMAFFETHDCFTCNEYLSVSEFGLTEPGEEHRAIAEGYTAFDGAKPINPSGGLIGVGHPVGASGVRMFLDLYKQIAGKAGSYQIRTAHNGMMLNIGGTATTNYVFIVGRA